MTLSDGNYTLIHVTEHCHASLAPLCCWVAVAASYTSCPKYMGPDACNLFVVNSDA